MKILNGITSRSPLLAVAAMVGLGTPAMAGFSLGEAGNFAVLAGSAVTNTGASLIDGGDIGVSSTSSITGFPSGKLASPYTMHAGDALASSAHADLVSAYNAAAAMTSTTDLTGQDLGGMVLTPGVYSFSSSAQLTGTLTLDDLGDSAAQFIFQIGSTLTTATGAAVVTVDGGSGPGAGVYWQVGSSATIGTNTAFEGHLLALANITANTGASILDGSALAVNGDVWLDTNRITNAVESVPEPESMTLVALGVASCCLAGRLGAASSARRREGPTARV